MLPIIKRAMRYLNREIMFPRRYNFLAKELSPYLDGVKSILDVGSSNGRLIRTIGDKLGGVEVSGCDTHIQPEPAIAIRQYDGKSLPYADESFDCILFVDVLHHTQNQEELLREAKRVTRKYVLIKDHYWNSRLDWHVLKWADYLGNAPFDIALPYAYLTVADWRRSFEQVGLRIVQSKLFTNYFFDPCKHVVYYLTK